MPRDENYFDPEWVKSRRGVVRELREYAEHGPPEPQANWDVLWVLSGPQLDWDGVQITPGEQPANYNQTRKRWETGLQLARRVTALRLKKTPDEVTMEDLATNGPMIYYNSVAAGNDLFQEFVRPGGRLETEQHFPGSKVKITANREIKHTGHQFEDFPADLIQENRKVVIISDLYHLARVKRYVEKFYEKVPPENVVLYAAEPTSLPIKDTLGEIRKIYKYAQAGIVSPEPEE